MKLTRSIGLTALLLLTAAPACSQSTGIEGQYAQAEPLLKRSLAIAEKALGPDHPNVATSLENMAVLYRETGRVKAGQELEKRVLAIRARQ